MQDPLDSLSAAEADRLERLAIRTENRGSALYPSPPSSPEALTEFPFGSGFFVISQRDGERGAIDKAGNVYYVGCDKRGGGKSPILICEYLKVEARTRDDRGENHGRLLQWRDPDGCKHEWAMPLELLKSDGADIRARLFSGGLYMNPARSARDLLPVYIQQCPTNRIARCVDKLGWHDRRFVLPDQVIGDTGGEAIVFQSASAVIPAFSASGTSEQWRENVAALASGNSRLTFAASLSFAGPLLDVVGMEGGGFHLCGATSTGKSTALLLAASVFGRPSEYRRSWRTTSNGLEAISTLHNDGLLCLDEIQELSNPAEAGQIAFMLANGSGKTRANRSGAARAIAQWRLIFLSSGNVSLTDLMKQAGHRPNVAHEIRVADIGADAGTRLGVFEDIHGCETPGKFAERLAEMCERYYGAAGVEYLRRLVAKRGELADQIKAAVSNFVGAVTPAGASGPVSRVARRFGLVAVAGELATDFGITGWSSGAAKEAAKACFEAWLENFGTGDRERTQLISQVKAFFEAHGTSRFQDMTALNDKVINRAGFHRTDSVADQKTFYVLPEVFRQEICRGFNLKTAKNMLIEIDLLIPGPDGRRDQSVHIPGQGQTRVYVISGRIFEMDVGLVS